MTPSALVTITLKRLAALDGALLASAQRPYALAHIGGRTFGRSRTLPSAGGDFDLGREPLPWTNRVAADGWDIPVVVELWDDREDAAPAKLGEISGVVPVPYFPIEMTIGGAPGIVVAVHSEPVPAVVNAAAVPRVAVGMKTRAALRPVNSVVVELTDIVGLYAPVATGVAGGKRSEHRAGYLSEDHLGRVFLNHDLTKNWASNTHQIQLEAKVSAVRGLVPPDAKIHWRVLDVDDPSNDAPGVHRQWGHYLDPHDYDGKGVPKGASAGDNEGKPSHDPPWLEVAGFALASKAKTEATTAIVGGVSKVILQCPSTAGDNFIVAAEVQAKSRVESFGTRTGIITMWHRVQLQSLKMKSAFPLPTEEVPVPFEHACVELEVAPTTEIEDRQFMAANGDAVDDECAVFVDANFSHKADPGWFCMIAAMEPHPLPAVKGEKVFTGTIEVKQYGSGKNHYDFFEIPGAFPDVDFAMLKFGTEQVGFQLFSIQVEHTAAGDITRCWLTDHDCQPEFTAGDGSIKHAYAVSYGYSATFRRKGATVTPGGYGVPRTCEAEVFNPGAFYVAGVSPTVKKSGAAYFAGRTIVFTHHKGYRDAVTGAQRPGFRDRALRVMVHELVHAFGMPHKCGYFDLRAPRAKTCCMNYDPNWMIDDKKNLIPGTSRKTGMDLCGRHIKEVRRVRLQDNKGLGWK